MVRDPRLSKSIRIAVISLDSGDLISDLGPDVNIMNNNNNVVLMRW
jgi:hypothetical protein